MSAYLWEGSAPCPVCPWPSPCSAFVPAASRLGAAGARARACNGQATPMAESGRGGFDPSAQQCRSRVERYAVTTDCALRLCSRQSKAQWRVLALAGRLAGDLALEVGSRCVCHALDRGRTPWRLEPPTYGPSSQLIGGCVGQGCRRELAGRDRGSGAAVC